MKYFCTFGREPSEWDSKGRAIRDSRAEFESLADALEFEAQHGGVIEREDGLCLAPDGSWV